MSSTTSSGFARLTGVAFALAFVGGLATSEESPEEAVPTDELVRFYHDNASGLRASAWVAVLAAVALVLFGSHLRQVLRQSSGWGRGLGAAATAGTAVYATGMALFAVCAGALADAGDLGDPQVLRSLHLLDGSSFFVVMTGMACTYLATGLGALRGSALPRWLAGLTVVLGVLAPAGPGGFVAFAAFPFWVVAVAFLGRASVAEPWRDGSEADDDELEELDQRLLDR